MLKNYNIKTQDPAGVHHELNVPIEEDGKTTNEITIELMQAINNDPKFSKLVQAQMVQKPTLKVKFNLDKHDTENSRLDSQQ